MRVTWSNRPSNFERKFYVYCLFDAEAIPRYIGKGQRDRWLAHDRTIDPNNHLKNDFIARTLKAIGEIPKVKIAENLTNQEALDLEELIIEEIGRQPDGPLINRFDPRFLHNLRAKR